MIRYIYTFFVGLFLAIFVGMGIAVFYEAPVSPDPPTWYQTNLGKDGPTDIEKQQEQAYLAQQKSYEKLLWRYNKNVSMIVLVCAVAVLVVSLAFAEKLGIIADGILLGGIFTLLYGIGRGMATDSNKYRFLVASIGLLITLTLGYVKFNRYQITSAKEKLV